MKKLITNLILVAAFFLVMNVKSIGQTAYVTDSFGVHVIDVTTNIVTDSIRLYDNYYFDYGTSGAVSVSPDGTKVYVAGHDTIDVINTATNTISAKIPGISAVSIVVCPDGSKLYAAEGNVVFIINTSTNSVTDTITIALITGEMLDGICISPDGTKVYVVKNGGPSSSVSVINTLTDTVEATINVNGNTNIYDVAITPDGTKVYVGADEGVYVINTATNTVIAGISVFGWAYAITISPDGSKAYSSCWTSQSVYVINTATNTVSDTIHIPGDIWGISITPDGSKLYVANSADNNVTVVSTATNTITDSIPVARYPIAFGNFISTYPVISTGILSQSKETPNISIYPNPASKTITIDLSALEQKKEFLIITDILGNEVHKQTLTGINTKIDVSQWSNGVYFYQITDNKKTLRGKLVKTN